MIYLIAKGYGSVYVGYVQNLQQIESGWDLTLINKDEFYFIDTVLSARVVPYIASGCYWKLLDE